MPRINHRLVSEGLEFAIRKMILKEIMSTRGNLIRDDIAAHHPETNDDLTVS